LLVLLV